MAAIAPWGLASLLGHVRAALPLWGLLAAVLLRGLIPAGYMPDPGALKLGQLELTLCTASGERVAFSLPLDGLATSGAPDGHGVASDPDCPFGLLSQVTPALLALAFWWPWRPTQRLARRRAWVAPPPAIRLTGPALGPRAPPC